MGFSQTGPRDGVRRKKRRLATLGLDGLGAGFTPFGIASEDSYFRPGFGQSLCQGAAEDTRCANHYCYLSRQIK
jgi:hypothetical protein